MHFQAHPYILKYLIIIHNWRVLDIQMDVYPGQHRALLATFCAKARWGGYSMGYSWPVLKPTGEGVAWGLSAVFLLVFISSLDKPKTSFQFIFPLLAGIGGLGIPGLYHQEWWHIWDAVRKTWKRRGVAWASSTVSHQSAVHQSILALGFKNKFEKKIL